MKLHSSLLWWKAQWISNLVYGGYIRLVLYNDVRSARLIENSDAIWQGLFMTPFGWLGRLIPRNFKEGYSTLALLHIPNRVQTPQVRALRSTPDILTRQFERMSVTWATKLVYTWYETKSRRNICTWEENIRYSKFIQVEWNTPPILYTATWVCNIDAKPGCETLSAPFLISDMFQNIRFKYRVELDLNASPLTMIS